MRMGTRKRRVSAPMPTSITKVNRIASPRGIRRENHRTGKESAIASAKPPSSTTGTVGAAHMSHTTAASPSTRIAFQVLLEILIRVGRDPERTGATRVTPPSGCFIGLHPRAASNGEILIFALRPPSSVLAACPGQDLAQFLEVFFHLLADRLDEPSIVQDVLDLVWGGVAANVFFPDHVFEVSPLLEAVDDVLENLLLPVRVGVNAEESV